MIFITLDRSQKKDSKYVNTHSVNLLYFIVDKLGRFIEEKEGSKYLVFASKDNNKEVLKKENLIEKIIFDNEMSKYGKD